MALPSDTECVVLCRETKRKDLTLSYIVKGENAIERAWRLANSIEKQEHLMGNPAFQARVAKSVEYFEGKLQILNPPKGFDFELPREEAEEGNSYILQPEVPGIPEKQLEKLPEIDTEVEVIGERDVSDIAEMFKGFDEDPEPETPDEDDDNDDLPVFNVDD